MSALHRLAYVAGGFLLDTIYTKCSIYRNLHALRNDTAQIKKDGADIKEDLVQVKENGAELKQDTAQIKKDGADIKEDLVQVKENGAELKQDTAQIKKDGAEIKVGVAQIGQDMAQLKQSVEQLLISNNKEYVVYDIFDNTLSKAGKHIVIHKNEEYIVHRCLTRQDGKKFLLIQPSKDNSYRITISQDDKDFFMVNKEDRDILIRKEKIVLDIQPTATQHLDDNSAERHSEENSGKYQFGEKVFPVFHITQDSLLIGEIAEPKVQFE